MLAPFFLTPAPLLRLGQRWEKLGLILPRSFLNWAEIRATPNLVPDAEVKKCLDFWHSRKVALVRQTAYRGAYLPDPGQNWVKTVLTAPAHLGPISFLAELQADYFVVSQALDPETHLWMGNIARDPDPQASLRKIQTWQAEQSNMGVVDCENVRWDDYDLVICLDIPVPTRIVSKSRKTIWAYYSVEAGGPLHKRSLTSPMPGYHIYLNHCFRRYRARPRNKNHVLEFPFTFQSSAAWKHLTNETTAGDIGRQGAIVDRASWQSHVGKKPAWMIPLSGNAAAYIRLMSSSEFAIRTDPKTRWGNWALEAIQAGCLFLGRADSLAMPGVLLPELIVADLATAHKKIEGLLKNPLHMQSLAQTQAALAEHLAFRRPLMDLTACAKKFFTE
ncbi:MAG: hypothetical protein EBZ78_05405 [Verrucomicrobia bacterium]|nr:hypothetical protein [Verrucomicrobiota bacterium]